MDQDAWRALLLRLHAEGRHAELVQALSEASSSEWGVSVEGRDLTGIDLHGLKISGLELCHAAMSRANLSRGILEKVCVLGVNGSWADLSHTTISGTLHGTFEHASFRAANLRDAALDGTFRCADFSGADLRDATLGWWSTYEDANFTCVRLGSSEEPSYLGMQGEGVSFRKARMIGADLSRMDMKLATFDEADLTRAILDNAAFMPGEEESHSRFRGTCLREVRARKAVFFSADMQGCDLSGADLTGAKLESCDLRGAILEGARLDEANLHGARASATTRWPALFDPVAAGVVMDREW
ncbi:MAG: pentapeptide repeat-containing protein [Chloroflexota bacterium]